MNISELGGGQPHQIPAGPHFQAASSPDREGQVKNLDESSDGSVSFVRDTDVSQLAQQIGRDMDVRSELVAEIKQKVESGIYQTRESADQVAAEILNLIR